jgi:hypothetical protein
MLGSMFSAYSSLEPHYLMTQYFRGRECMLSICETYASTELKLDKKQRAHNATSAPTSQSFPSAVATLLTYSSYPPDLQ